MPDIRITNAPDSPKATFTLKAPKAGRYLLQVFTQPHPNRSSKTPVTVRRDNLVREHRIDQRAANQDHLVTVSELDLRELQEVVVTISTEGADGNVHVDAVRLLEVK